MKSGRQKSFLRSSRLFHRPIEKDYGYGVGAMSASRALWVVDGLLSGDLAFSTEWFLRCSIKTAVRFDYVSCSRAH